MLFDRRFFLAHRGIQAELGAVPQIFVIADQPTKRSVREVYFAKSMGDGWCLRGPVEAWQLLLDVAQALAKAKICLGGIVADEAALVAALKDDGYIDITKYLEQPDPNSTRSGKQMSDNKVVFAPHLSRYAGHETVRQIVVRDHDSLAELEFGWDENDRCYLYSYDDGWALFIEVLEALLPSGDPFSAMSMNRLEASSPEGMLKILVLHGFEDVTHYPTADPNSLRERLAADEHDRWSRWMRHMLNRGGYQRAGHEEFFLIPARLMDGWKRQAHTAYADLTEKEKDWDRKEADRIIAILKTGRLPG